MIAKCTLVVFLAVFATAQSACIEKVVPACGSCAEPAVVVSGSSSNGVVVGSSAGVSGAITRNIVAKGKYPVALKNCGPTPDQQIPVTTSRSTAPCQEKPTIRLPAKIPAPKTVCHTCTCYKTIVRPRVHQHIITVPTVQRYIETLHKPVVENIQYEAIPVNCEGAGSSFGSAKVVSVDGSSCGSSVQAVQVPSGCGSCASPVEVSCARPVEVSCAQSVQVPSCGVSCAQPVEVSCARPVEVSCAPSFQIPSFDASCARPCDLPCAQPIQIPSFDVSCARPAEVSCARPVEVSCARPVEVSCARPVELLQTAFGCSQC